MRDQTCSALWSALSNSLRAARALVGQGSKLRLGLITCILAAAALLGLWRFFSSSGSADADAMELVPALVAGRYVPSFEILDSRAVCVKNLPRAAVLPGALRAVEELVDTQGMPMYRASVALPEGHPISRALLMEISKSHSLAPLLQPGQVAVSFAVDRVRGVGGWVEPGDHIAVFQAFGMELPGQKSPPARLVLPGLTVLAVDNRRLGAHEGPEEARGNSFQDPGSQDQAGTILTVRTTSLEATTLIQAQEKGHLTVALRAIGDELIEEEAHGK